MCDGCMRHQFRLDNFAFYGTITSMCGGSMVSHFIYIYVGGGECNRDCLLQAQGKASTRPSVRPNRQLLAI